ncbi:MAG TPA: ArgE/DapE family deacylase [Thermodesulfobacteriota bacterium]|nr:ArgE/DapE family deacylase [Thermodesulfobacteriota bacterium]
MKTQTIRKIDQMTDEIFQTIQELVRIPSVVGHEGEAQEWMAKLYQFLGLRVEKVVPKKEDLMNHPAYIEVGIPYTESRPNIVGIYPGTGAGKSIILNGHIDVVSPEPVETWDGGNPWSGRIEGNRLYGRGAADMKGGLLSNFFALKALLDLGLKAKGKIILESVIEEEAGGSGGTLALFLAGYKADAMIIPEPLDLKIITAHPGVNYFRVKVYGKTAHAGQSHMGINAIGKLARIYDRLTDLDQERAERNRDPFFEKLTGRSCNLNIGTFRSGDWPSTVAGSAVLEARISYLPKETEEDIKREVEEAVIEVAAKDEWLIDHPPHIEWFGWRAKPWVQAPSIPLIQQFSQTASDVLSTSPEISATTAGLDTRFGPFFNTPSFVFGPVGGLLHCSNEYVELDSVIKTIKVLSAFIVDWCGVE